MPDEIPNEPPNIPPANPEWAVPPQQVQGQQPGPQMPGYYQQLGQPSGSFDNLIPTKNPPALIAYYLGVFSIVCGILGPFALGFGIKGLNDIKKQPGLPGRAHAIVGVVMGAIFTLLYGALFVLMIVAFLNRSNPREY